jgi:hypothetical protein
MEKQVSNLYFTTISVGDTYNVTTDKHHADHDDATFKQYLLDVIKNTTSGVITGVVVSYVFKGKK